MDTKVVAEAVRRLGREKQTSLLEEVLANQELRLQALEAQRQETPSRERMSLNDLAGVAVWCPGCTMIHAPPTGLFCPYRMKTPPSSQAIEQQVDAPNGSSTSSVTFLFAREGQAGELLITGTDTLAEASLIQRLGGHLNDLLPGRWTVTVLTTSESLSLSGATPSSTPAEAEVGLTAGSSGRCPACERDKAELAGGQEQSRE